MRRLLLSVAAALTLTAGVGASVADAQQDPVAHGVAVAEAAWPGSPCAGGINVTVAPLPPIGNEVLDGYATGVEVAPDGSFVTRSCDIQIDPQVLAVGPEHTCDVIVHEAGHLAGLQHTATGIMAPSAGTFPACHPVLSPRAQVQELLSGLLPEGYTWTIHCTRPAITRCRATAPGAHPRRFEVEVDSSGVTASVL